MITEPYWKKAGDNELSALDMGNIYTKLKNVLETCIENPSLMTSNKIQLCEDNDMPRNSVYSCLFDLSDEICNSLTENLLIKFCKKKKGMKKVNFLQLTVPCWKKLKHALQTI